jgi:virginiamycin B lyase
MNARRVALTLACALALSACGGGGGVTPSSPQTSPGSPNTAMQRVAISLIVPINSGTTSTARRPAYISASALGAGIVVAQGATTVNATIDLSSGSSACTGSGSSRTCTATITVPTGNDVFTVTIYNQAPVSNTIPAGAAILGVGSSTVDVVAGSTASVQVFVGGQIAHFGATIPSGSLPANGQPQSAVIVIAPTDFGDNPITAGTSDPYANPITVAVTESGGSGYASLSLNGGAASSSVQVTKSTDSVSLNYTGGGVPGYSFTITLSASGVVSQSSTIAPLIASVNGNDVTSISLNGSAVGALQLGLGEAGSSRTYTAMLTNCSNIATVGAVSGSGASATLPVTGGSAPSASGCTLTITDSGSVALVLTVTNTPVGATVTVNGTQISEYGGYGAPYGITKGSDGNIWFTDQVSQEVEALNPASLSIQYQYATGANLWDIATGSDSALWVADQSNGGALRVTTSGIETQYPFSGTPQGIAPGPNGLMLIADNTSGGVWTLDSGGLYTILPFSPSGTPSEVTWVPGGASGDAWFAETNYIGDFSLNNNTITTQFPVLNSNNANYVAYGPDGNVWVTASGGTAPIIEVINPSTDAVATIPLNASSNPQGIVAGVDHAMWFADPGTNSIGEVNLSTHAVTEFPLPTSGAGPQEITVGPDGSLWFTEKAVGKIGHAVP